MIVSNTKTQFCYFQQSRKSFMSTILLRLTWSWSRYHIYQSFSAWKSIPKWMKLVKSSFIWNPLWKYCYTYRNVLKFTIPELNPNYHPTFYQFQLICKQSIHINTDLQAGLQISRILLSMSNTWCILCIKKNPAILVTQGFIICHVKVQGQIIKKISRLLH